MSSRATWTVSLLVGAALLTACESSPTDGEVTLGATANGSAAHDGESTPAFEEVVVRRGDFQVVLNLDGVVQQGSEVGLMARESLELVGHLGGAEVEAGQVVGTVRIVPEVKDRLSRSDTGPDRSRLAELEFIAGREVVAPVAGQVHDTPQGVMLSSTGLDVRVPLSPLQQLRLRNLDLEAMATVETTVGQRRFSCDATWSPAVVPPPRDSASVAEGGDVDAGGELFCRLPPQAETAPGLRATLEVRSRPLSDVLLIPNIFIGYELDEYTVVVETRDGVSTELVDVGPTDGVVRVVLSDLPEGATLVEQGVP